jgi:ATP-dependent helicase/nuclease subunit A
VEETKRLLYVAMTRARDRLYLAGTATAGKLVLQRGSLGRVLPPTLPALMADDGAESERTWQGASALHRLRKVAGRFALRL